MASGERWKKQDRFYVKDESTGNCLKAAIASILNLPMADVPEFGESKRWYGDLLEFLEEHGYHLYQRHTQGQELWIPKCLCIVCGPSSRGVPHAVIYKDGRLFHDPHPSNEGVLSVDELWLLVPIDPAAGRR